MHYHIHYELAAMAKKLKQFAQEAEENEQFTRKLLEQEHIAPRLAAEAKVTELEDEVTRLRSQLTELSARNQGQTKMIRQMRKALNGRGRNPLPGHAQAVFNALKEAAPEHPLVTYTMED